MRCIIYVQTYTINDGGSTVSVWRSGFLWHEKVPFIGVQILLINYQTIDFYFFIPHPFFCTASCLRPAPAVINGLWRIVVGKIPLPAQYWWAVRMRLSPPRPSPPLLSSTPIVSKLVRPNALPAHAQMQITQRQSFISNQTREAAEHPGSWVPTEPAVSERLWLKERQRSAAAGYTILGGLPEEFALMQREMSGTQRAALSAQDDIFSRVQAVKFQAEVEIHDKNRSSMSEWRSALKIATDTGIWIHELQFKGKKSFFPLLKHKKSNYQVNHKSGRLAESFKMRLQ